MITTVHNLKLVFIQINVFFFFFLNQLPLCAFGLHACSAAGEGRAADTWCRLSGLRLQKSHTMSGSFMWVWGLRFCVWMKDGNCTVYRNHVWIVWHVISFIMGNCKIFTSHTHQEGISDEENGGVVASQVPVALFTVKLDRKASWISHGVCWPRFTSWEETHLSDESAVSAAMILRTPSHSPTVEKRTAMGVVLPTCSNTLALQ